MPKATLNFAAPNRYLPQLLIMGPCLGVAGYFMGSAKNIGEALLIHTLICLSIGYGLLFLLFNKDGILPKQWPNWQRYLVLAALFVVVGILGSEIEQVVRKVLLQEGPYHFMRLNGGHAFNAVLSPVLGFTFDRVFQEIRPKETSEVLPKVELEKIPVKKGDHTIFIQVDDIAYIEAADMYAYLHTKDGNKQLCDYALGFLAERLPSAFTRIHRKYIVNKKLVTRIAPHLKGRYEIGLGDSANTKLVSSSSYSATIKSMIKIVD
jgi:hypothetical protein